MKRKMFEIISVCMCVKSNNIFLNYINVPYSKFNKGNFSNIMFIKIKVPKANSLTLKILIY